ncbi:PD-(D/E)XK nuclease family protein [Peribacillus asahii]|uniref:PD-(D/E)XK nuclease family protein n=1 Tax=Peribacillus asahii TaxID=228899 RepID=UPI0038162C0C
MRLSFEQLDMIKEKMGVDKLWSFSKVGTYDQCSWLYKLKYIDKLRVKGDNCYTWWGSVAHEIIQDWYEGKYPEYGQMLEELEKKVIEYSMLDDKKLKFPSDKEWENYIANLRHYFSHVETIPFKVTNEQAVLAVFEGLEKYVFQGYIDSEYIDEDDCLVILDYKTSSMSGFTGKKLIEKARQLMIYAIGISQHGRMIDGEMRKFPLDKIKIRYDMMKYCNITFMQKNGKPKTTKAERKLWVAHIANPLRKDLEDVPKNIEKLEKEIAKLEKKMNMKKTTPEDAEGYSVACGEIALEIEALKPYVFDPIQINEMIEKATVLNDLSVFPPFVQEKYTVGNCHIDVEMTDEVIEEFKRELVDTLDTIITKTAEEDKEEAFNRSRIENSDSYYCVNLCDLKDHCQFYKEFKEHNEMFITKQNQPSEQDLLAMLGLV